MTITTIDPAAVAREILRSATSREAATAEIERRIQAQNLSFVQAKDVDDAIDTVVADSERAGARAYAAPPPPPPTAEEAKASFRAATRGWPNILAADGTMQLPEGALFRRLALLRNSDPIGGGSRFYECTITRVPDADDPRIHLRGDGVQAWTDFLRPADIAKKCEAVRIEPELPTSWPGFQTRYAAPRWRDIPLELHTGQPKNSATAPVPGDTIALYCRVGRRAEQAAGRLVSVPRYPRGDERTEDTVRWVIRGRDGEDRPIPRDVVLALRVDAQLDQEFDERTRGMVDLLYPGGVSPLPEARRAIGSRVHVLYRNVEDDNVKHSLEATLLELPGQRNHYAFGVRGKTVEVYFGSVEKLRIAPTP